MDYSKVFKRLDYIDLAGRNAWKCVVLYNDQIVGGCISAQSAEKGWIVVYIRRDGEAMFPHIFFGKVEILEMMEDSNFISPIEVLKLDGLQIFDSYKAYLRCAEKPTTAVRSRKPFLRIQ